MAIYLKNPHSILAVLDKRPQDVYEIKLVNSSGVWDEVQARAEEIGIRIDTSGKTRRNRKEDSARGGKSEAQIKEHPGVSLDAITEEVSDNQPGLWIALDTLQDPRNVVAIFRSAAFFGAKGIVLTRDRSAPLSSAVYDVASGGVEHMPFSVQTNLSRTLDEAKKAGLWILGSSERADMDLSQVNPDRPWLLVLGNEERGLRRLTLEKCDTVCQIPSRGDSPSLNVAVAAGILMHRLSV